MKFSEKIIENELEVLELIAQGVNPLEYIEGEKDIDLIARAVTHKEKTIDPFWDDMAEILLKSIIHYLYGKADETKSLARCKEILDKAMNSSDKKAELSNIIGDNESAKALYRPIEIAADKTADSIFDTLNEKLSDIVK